MPWENGRKRRYSDVLEDPYKGPKEFMEAGVRGFLVTSVPDREEHALDEAVKSLRKSCIKLYGGIRPLRREDASFAKGYVMVDFMDPEAVIPIPHPDADKFAAEAKEKEKEAEKAPTEGGKEKETEAMEEETKDKVVEEEPEKEKADQEDEKVESKEEESESKGEEKSEDKGEGEKVKEEKSKEEKTDQKKKEELRKKKKEEEEKAKPPLMLAPHKFQSFRTELRNIMFIKADVADPAIVATTAFDLIMERKPLLTDCINQLLPVQGVCDNDYKQLEIMCRRVLTPYFGEHLEAEEPPSFGVMLVDKMSEPGAEVLLEVIRSAIWCLDPNAYQCSPWSEPDIVIHVEIIGSKIILSAMKHYMKYRQYSPFACHEMGEGKPEDEDSILKEKQEEKDKDRNRDKDKDSRRKKRDRDNKGSKDGSHNKKKEAENKEKPIKKPEEKENLDKDEKKETETTEETETKEEAKDGSEKKPCRSSTEKKSKS